MLTKNAPPSNEVHVATREYTPSVGISILIWLVALNFFRIGCQLVISAWSAVQVTGRTESVGHILLISSAANLVLSPLIGAIIDRFTRKKSLLLISHVGVALSGAAPCLIALLIPKLACFASVAFAALLSSVSGIVVGGAMDYFMKTCISQSERMKKLAMINSIAQLTLIAGTAVGGFIVSSVSWSNAYLTITACGLVLTALCAVLLPPLTVISDEKVNWRRGVFSVGPALYVQHRHLFSIACCAALAFAIGQVTNTLLPALMSLYLGLTGRSYSLVEAAWSIGALAASLGLAKFVKGEVGQLSRDFIFILVMAGLLSFVPQLSWLPALLAAHLMLGAGFSFVRVRSETRFLTECPTHLLGRFRANSLFITSLAGVVIFATPTIFDDFSVPALYQLLSAMVAVSSVAILAFARRQRSC